jgi:hypothetical protein
VTDPEGTGKEPSQQDIQRIKDRFDAALEAQRVAAQTLQRSTDGFKDRLLGQGGRVSTEDLVGLLNALAAFMSQMNAFRDEATDTHGQSR